MKTNYEASNMDKEGRRRRKEEIISATFFLAPHK
jgi:hypothetical protein